MAAKTLARDRELMARCIELAGKAAGRTSPNPLVGSVVVDRMGRVVAEGWHKRAGTQHAEAIALNRAGNRAVGGTLYVNLEPCRHTGRTPPCTDKVLASGVSRVVIGMRDPIGGHGGGAPLLARRGLKVTTGVLAQECAELNRFFVTWASEGRPWVTLKAGITLDGKIATYSGQSQWITGPEARKRGHRLRSSHDAIVVGIGTAIADNPRLTARAGRGSRDPVRVVIDSCLRLPPRSALLPVNAQGSLARVILATTTEAPGSKERSLTVKGAEVWRLAKTRSGRVRIDALLKRLAAEDILSILVEGGPTVHGACMDADVVDELQLFLNPSVLGGEGKRAGMTWVGGRGVSQLANRMQLEVHGAPTIVGGDVHMIMRRSARSNAKGARG